MLRAFCELTRDNLDMAEFAVHDAGQESVKKGLGFL